MVDRERLGVRRFGPQILWDEARELALIVSAAIATWVILASVSVSSAQSAIVESMAVDVRSPRCPRCRQPLLDSRLEVCAICYQRLGHAQRRAQVAPPPVEREEWAEQAELIERIEKLLAGRE